MERNEMLNDSLRDLQARYLAGHISLNALVHQCEALLGQGELLLLPDIYQRATNCVYLLEVINAVVLDESRPINDRERASIEEQLKKLLLIVAEK